MLFHQKHEKTKRKVVTLRTFFFKKDGYKQLVEK